MRILHVLSQVFVSGPEYYATALADAHIAQGHTVFIMSDTLTASTQATYIRGSIHKRTPLHRIKNILLIRRFIRKNKIDIVHAHSRASSWVSFFATRGTRTPLVSTVHGRQHLHGSVTLFSIYGDRVIAICEAVKKHLVSEVKLPEGAVSIIPNGFNLRATVSSASPLPSQIDIMVIGRTNGPKGERTSELLQHVFPGLLEDHPDLHVTISGGDPNNLPSFGREAIELLSRTYPGRIHVMGFTRRLCDLICRSHIVIASGRIAIEALYLGKQVIAFGEACCPGVVTPQNFESVRETNFGDILENRDEIQFDYPRLSEQINLLLRSPIQPTAYRDAVAYLYDITHVAEKVFNAYRAARIQRMRKSHIPILMYHKISGTPLDSRHRIFVTRDVFEKQLKALRQWGREAITFHDLEAFVRGDRPTDSFPKRPVILTFDDGYRDNLTNALPLMNRYGFKGVLFPLADKSQTYNYWDADDGEHRDDLLDQRDLGAFIHSGWEIGAHTFSHFDLTECDVATLNHEINDCKKTLETMTGIPALTFAYPFGRFNPNVKRAVQHAGYLYAVATDTGGRRLADDLFEIFRTPIFPRDKAFQIIKKTAPWYRDYFNKKHQGCSR